MFETLKAFFNNLDESKYLKIRGLVKYKKKNAQGEEIYGDELNKRDSDVDIDANIREIERLQTDVRHKNLHVFASNFALATGKQTAVYTVPAVLIAINIALWVLPNTRVASDNLEGYKIVETVITEEQQLEDYSDGNRYFSTFMGRDFVNDTDKNIMQITSDMMYFQIKDDLDGFLAKLTIDSEGKLAIESVEKGKYIDLTEYDFTNAEALEARYVSLFDEVIEMIHDSNYINKSQKEELLAMAANDKRDILIRIVNYENLGELSVPVIKNNWGWRVGLLIVAAIYICVLGYIRYDNNGPFESNRLYNEEGELKSDFLPEKGLLFLGLKYRAAFLKAEQDRIRRLYDLYRETLHSSMKPEDVMTLYEKKLVHKEK